MSERATGAPQVTLDRVRKREGRTAEQKGGSDTALVTQLCLGSKLSSPRIALPRGITQTVQPALTTLDHHRIHRPQLRLAVSPRFPAPEGPLLVAPSKHESIVSGGSLRELESLRGEVYRAKEREPP